MTADCPKAQNLRAFLLGFLTDAAAWDIEAHLSSCHHCSEQLVRCAPSDDLWGELRHSTAIGLDDPEVVTLTGRLRTLLLPPRPATFAGERHRDEIATVGRYEITATLGRGGMGIVYRAFDPQLKRHVAIKVLLDRRFSDPTQQLRLQREAETLAQLNHPAIVSIHEVGMHDGQPFLALEYMDGGTLATMLQGQPQSLAACIQLLSRLAHAVDYANEQGVIHRDLKPSNVLLASSTAHPFTTAKIGDFGLARRPEASDLTVSGDLLGTPGYSAPEQTVGQKARVGPTADVYALGAILYELLTGRPPFRGDNLLETLEQARTTDPIAPRRLRPSIPRDVETITLKCLQRNPKKRYARAAELAADLERFQHGHAIHAKRASNGERVIKWVQRNPLATAFIMVLLGAAIALGLARHRTKQALATATAKETQAQQANARANANYQAAREAMQKMLQRTSHLGGGEIPGLRTLTRQQQEDALEFYRIVAANVSDDPTVKRDAALASSHAAYLQNDFGRTADAAENFRTAARLYAELVAADATDSSSRCGYVDMLVALAMSETDVKVRRQQLETARTLGESLTRDFPAFATGYGSWAAALHNLGYAAYHDGDRALAERYFRNAVTAREQQVQRGPNDRQALIRLAVSLSNLYYFTQHNKQADAEALGERTDALLVQIYHEDKSDYLALARLGDHRTNRAYGLFHAGRGDVALRQLTEVIDLLEKAHQNEPTYGLIKNALYTTHGARAEVSVGLKQHDLSIASWRRVVVFAPAAQRVSRWLNLLFSLEANKRIPDLMAEADRLATHLQTDPHPTALIALVKYAVRHQQLDKALTWAKLAKQQAQDWEPLRTQLRTEPAIVALEARPEWLPLLQK